MVPVWQFQSSRFCLDDGSIAVAKTTGPTQLFGMSDEHRGTNVLGEPIEMCSADPLTGFYRDGCCRTGGDDQGMHTVCAVMTEAFLDFSVRAGNDLSTPRPEFGFPGLEPGDRWCVCLGRWVEAYQAGAIAPVVLEATHISVLEFISIEDLRAAEWAE
jgi:uncharacterized protein (DUF2237 family)